MLCLQNQMRPTLWGRLMVAALLSVFWINPAVSQSTDDEIPFIDDVAFQLWMDYNPSWMVTPRLEVYGDIGLRDDFEEAGWLRFVVRPGVRYQLNRHTRIAGGIGSLYTQNKVYANRWEVRPWVGLNVRLPRDRLVIDNYLRFEGRVDYNTETWEALILPRIRYRLRGFTDWGRTRPGQYWRALASAEVFITLTGQRGQFQERSRVVFGLERGYRPGRRVRFDVTWQKEGFPFSDETFNDILLRFRWFTRFGG